MGSGTYRRRVQPASHRLVFNGVVCPPDWSGSHLGSGDDLQARECPGTTGRNVQAAGTSVDCVRAELLLATSDAGRQRTCHRFVLWYVHVLTKSGSGAWPAAPNLKSAVAFVRRALRELDDEYYDRVFDESAKVPSVAVALYPIRCRIDNLQCIRIHAAAVHGALPGHFLHGKYLLAVLAACVLLHGEDQHRGLTSCLLNAMHLGVYAGESMRFSIFFVDPSRDQPDHGTPGHPRLPHYRGTEGAKAPCKWRMHEMLWRVCAHALTILAHCDYCRPMKPPLLRHWQSKSRRQGHPMT